MKRWIMAGLVALAALGLTGTARAYERIIDYTLKAGTAADSLAGNTKYEFDWVPVFGARMIVFSVADSLSPAYTDSLASVQFHVTTDGGTTWVPYTFGTAAITSVVAADSGYANISYTGKIQNIALWGAGPRIKIGVVTPYATAAYPATYFVCTHIRLVVVTAATKRCPAANCLSAGYRAVNRARILARVVYDGPPVHTTY